MNDFKLKQYIVDKVKDVVEQFIYKTCEQVYKRQISENDYHWSVIWTDACYHKIGFRFMDEGIPNKVMIYEFDGSLINTTCFVWGYPSVIAEIPSLNTMEDGSLIKELWKYIHWTVEKTNIVAEYREFVASVHQDAQSKRALNSWYGMLSPKLFDKSRELYVATAQALAASHSYEKANRVIVGLKELSESLEMPIITESQSCRLSDYNGKKITIMPDIKSVFFNEVKKTTTVVFNDDTSVVVKCTDRDGFDPEVGLAMALTKKLVGSRAKFQKLVDEWVATSAPKNEQLRKKAARKAEREAAKIEHAKAQAESYME